MLWGRRQRQALLDGEARHGAQSRRALLFRIDSRRPSPRPQTRAQMGHVCEFFQKNSRLELGKPSLKPIDLSPQLRRSAVASPFLAMHEGRRRALLVLFREK